jgi:hypothetical protein
MGYRKILLWSEKKDEVKEMFETVGWLCSLFEKVVPWSPELISNDRVTWLRCFGVPQHAWGVDLFRALAFKYGRFIEVDDCTHKFKRCDFARVKILTNERAVIDSSMAVKVLGRRFDIRVMEEASFDSDMNKVCVKRGIGWPEELSSRASGDGQSYQAVVEGISESGSDADVSESCQVLLEIKKHGGSRKVTSGRGKEIVQVGGEMSESFPNNLGNPLVLTTTLVNFDGDKGLGNAAGTEGTGGSWVGVQEEEEGGATSDEVVPLFGAKEVDYLCETGPAHQPIYGPNFIQTNKIDFCLVGPSITNNGEVQVTKNHVFVGEAQLLGKRKKSMSVKHSMRAPRPETNSNRGKAFHKGALPELPPNNKLRKLYTSNMRKNRNVKRKKAGQMIVATESSTTSDSIQNPEDPDMLLSQIAPPNQVEEAGDFTLEVVLPCWSKPTGEISAQRVIQEDSGTVKRTKRGD